MRFFDVTAFNRDGELIAAFEIKARLRTSPEWAAQYRRNLFSHKALPAVRYFGLVTPDHLYLWKGEHDSGVPERPDFMIDIAEALSATIGQVESMTGKHSASPTLAGYAFELLASAWLAGVLRGDTDPPEALKKSGLIDELRDGHLSMEAAA